MEPYADTREQYLEFAAHTRAESPCFAAWSEGVAGDPEVLAWIGSLPRVKQQPNLVFAAARWLGVEAPAPYSTLREALLGDRGPLRATILTRSTQTNEVGRLATLVPAFAHLARGRPLALLEVGASAGLCLYPDRYDYEWELPTGQVSLRSGGPTLRCRVTGAPPLPDAAVAVAWRGGIDLNPLDVSNPDAMAWLTNLVWPEQEDRRRLLSAAVAVALAEPPTLVRGDLLEELPALVERAAAHGPVVVFHSAVIAYLDPGGRLRFAEMMGRLVSEGACHWVSNEGPQVLPAVTATSGSHPEESTDFVLGVDGQAVARTHGHGSAMAWLER